MFIDAMMLVVVSLQMNQQMDKFLECMLFKNHRVSKLRLKKVNMNWVVKLNCFPIISPIHRYTGLTA